MLVVPNAQRPLFPIPTTPRFYIIALLASKIYNHRVAVQAPNSAESDRGSPCRPVERNVALDSSSPVLRNRTAFLVDRNPMIL